MVCKIDNYILVEKIDFHYENHTKLNNFVGLKRTGVLSVLSRRLLCIMMAVDCYAQQDYVYMHVLLYLIYHTKMSLIGANGTNPRKRNISITLVLLKEIFLKSGSMK